MANQHIYPTFTLVVHKTDSDEFATLQLLRNSDQDPNTKRSQLYPNQTQWLIPTLRTILGKNNLPLIFSGGSTDLTEVAALRLGLLISLVEGVYTWKALINLGSAVTALSVEECYYFFAKMNGTSRRGAMRKGLRLILAG